MNQIKKIKCILHGKQVRTTYIQQNVGSIPRWLKTGILACPDCEVKILIKDNDFYEIKCADCIRNFCELIKNGKCCIDNKNIDNLKMCPPCSKDYSSDLADRLHNMKKRGRN